MSLNRSNQQAHIDRRRRWVARLRLRGMTQREIVDRLLRVVEEGYPTGIRNPRTGKPYALGTINSDLKAVGKRWREAATQDIAAHKARQMAELAEVRRAAWAKGHLTSVLKALLQEAKLLGLNEPEEVRGSGFVVQVVGIDPDGREED